MNIYFVILLKGYESINEVNGRSAKMHMVGEVELSSTL